MWHYFLGALALMLIVEGLFPLLFPTQWRNTMSKLMQQPLRTIRMIGLVVFSVGIILWILIGFFELY